jgi:hypothetical protein
LISFFWLVPLETVMLVVTPGVYRFVSEKLKLGARPLTDAVTIYDPRRLFAVNMEEVAIPDASENTASVFVPLPANVPLGPLPGAVNVTPAPVTGLPMLSFTRI